MEFNWGDSIWALMVTKRPSDTHFSESSTSGGKSPLVRDDDDNALNTHAVLFDGGAVVLGVLAAGAVLTTAVVKAAPHARSGLVSLKSKLQHRHAQDATDAEAPVPLIAVAQEQPDGPRLRAV
ncbi:hypothetical protein [Streptacidiphilus carbonis]|uniref:hypothetical protein n=1 Tax=Streptacidiphilus carbonis TaxID=105422 RepID=UPI0005A67897|nr:hypothetical protein [Streptacidiphilus carbonis]